MTDIKTIVPISIFGPILKYALIKQGQVLVESCENYQKKSMRNRTHILGANGLLCLSVPLKKGKNLAAIKDVEISYDEDWIKNHLQSIQSAYGNAPYFEFYIHKIEAAYQKRPNKLIQLFEESYNVLRPILSLDNLNYTTDYYPIVNSTFDLRKSEKHIQCSIPPYIQVFEYRHNFVPNLSILDLIFNLGPESTEILKGVSVQQAITND